MPQGFNPPHVVQPFGIFSSAAWQGEGRILHLSGQVAQAADGSTVGIGDIEAQTRQVLDNLQQVLASVGGHMDDIVKVTVFVADMAHLEKVHQVRAEYFTPPYPASTLVEISRLVKTEYLIEIDAVASIPFERAPTP
ncbi:MAG: RidA family protein [Candidatus Latescibacteria bacterium]|nr:RidA family protein [Candidatus Latescibacterota bacterium]